MRVGSASVRVHVRTFSIPLARFWVMGWFWTALTADAASKRVNFEQELAAEVNDCRVSVGCLVGKQSTFAPHCSRRSSGRPSWLCRWWCSCFRWPWEGFRVRTFLRLRWRRRTDDTREQGQISESEGCSRSGLRRVDSNALVAVKDGGRVDGWMDVWCWTGREKLVQAQEWLHFPDSPGVIQHQ